MISNVALSCECVLIVKYDEIYTRSAVGNFDKACISALFWGTRSTRCVCVGGGRGGWESGACVSILAWGRLCVRVRARVCVHASACVRA